MRELLVVPVPELAVACSVVAAVLALQLIFAAGVLVGRLIALGVWL